MCEVLNKHADDTTRGKHPFGGSLPQNACSGMHAQTQMLKKDIKKYSEERPHASALAADALASLVKIRAALRWSATKLGSLCALQIRGPCRTHPASYDNASMS